MYSAENRFALPIKIFCMFAILVVGFAALLRPARGEQPIAVSYTLGNTGILPDHPFYKLKVLRDKLMLRFILNPVKKIEYYLILSDTGIAASSALVEKGKQVLAHETALKAEHYYTQLVSDYKWAIWYHRTIPSALTAKILLAAVKHQEVLSGLGFSDAAEFSKRNEQTLREFIAREGEKNLP